MSQSNPSRTLLEIVNHIVIRHPDLLSSIGALIFSGQDERDRVALMEWSERLYAPPAPQFIKQSVLLRNGINDSVWIETGTYLGDTTDFLARRSRHVYSIEPESALFEKARVRFESFPNVSILNDISENALPALLSSLNGNLCFWLDGHYSAGNTFAGPNDTPLRQELDCIAQNLHRFDGVVVLIDDIRLCGKKHIYGEYPTLDELVAFASSTGLAWHIESDIFVARR